MQLFLAGKDASSYLLKDKRGNEFTIGRVKRWHRDGVFIFILSILPCIAIEWIHFHTLYYSAVAAVLIRLSVFDLAFNKWANLVSTFLGSTAWVDKQFVKIFGVNGAVKKSLAFLILLTVLTIVVGKHDAGFYWRLF